MRGVEFFRPLLTRSLLAGPVLTGACVLLGAATSSCGSGEAEPAGPGSGPTSSTTGTAAGPTSSSADSTGTTVGTTGGVTATNTTGTTSTTGGVGTVGTSAGGVTTTTGGLTTNTGVGGGTSTGATVGTTTGGSGNCNITVDSYDLSPAIATVGVVTWSATSTIDSANIEFGPSDGEFTMSAPVDLAEPGYRTLLLGMKGQKEYSFRVVAMSGGQTCMSETYSLTTGPVDNSVPNISHQTQNAGMATKTGFIVLSAGLGGFGAPGGGGGAPAFIIDMDGDPVWWAPAPASCSRARMDWEGKNMWMLELNVDRGGGEMRKVAMDGTGAENNIQGLNNTHHDFTVLPGGIIATVSWGSGGGGEPPSDLIERAPDGTITKVATLDQNFYNPGGQGFHANSILWHEADQTYTVSDRYPNLYIKVTRTGELVWQFGGQNPVDQSKFISGGSWSVNHGHHLLDNGNLIVFSNGNGGQSPVIEYALDAQSMTATEVWRYQGGSSNVLGDVQRLENGNTFVTYSVSGVIQEVNGQSVLQSYTTDSLGYAMYRPTLYGPPPK